MDNWFATHEERQQHWREVREKERATPVTIDEAREKIRREISNARQMEGHAVFSFDGAEQLTRFIEAMIDLKVQEALASMQTE
jgi:hypothetical protein